MKPRKRPAGDRNIVGRNIARLRMERGIKQKDFISQIQLAGIDINPTSYSKLEGQFRVATDKEVFAIAGLLGVDVGDLFVRDGD